MEEWYRISLMLCTFGFFRELRPSEPFVTDFLTGEWRNITSEQVNRYIFPLGTYSYLVQLIIVFLITDILRYKPIIIISCFVGLGLFGCLLWTYTLLGLQFAQICYGFFMGAEIAYYTYIYAKVDRDKYEKVSGHTRCAILSGRFIGSASAQIFISFQLLNVRQLNYISFATQLVSLPIALMLPSVPVSLYFYHSPDEAKDTNNIELSKNTELVLANLSLDKTKSENQKDKEVHVRFSFKKALNLMYRHFIAAYTNLKVIEWSIWWSLAMCGFLLIQSYIQLLWKDIDSTKENFYNGAIEAALTLFGAIASFGAGFINNKNYQEWDVLILTICSAFEGVFILFATFTNNIWIAYIMYVLYGILYHFVITIASAKVAVNINEDSFGLIFGINTLIALILQSIFTVIAVSGQVLLLNIRTQFSTFGGYYIILSGLYGSTVIYRLSKKILCNKNKLNNNSYNNSTNVIVNS